MTGGGGFAGSHLSEHLVSLGWDVFVLAAEGEDLGNLTAVLDRLRVERGDLRNAQLLRRLVRSVSPDRVFHLAALSSPTGSIENPQATYEVNLLGSINLLLACHEESNRPSFLFVSSSEVYGPLPPDQMPLREETALRPTSPYAASKAAGEMVVYQFHRCYGLPAVIARPFNHTGPRQSPSFVCSDLARQVAEIELGLRAPQIQVGNLDIQRDFSDVRDVVRGYQLLLEKGIAGEVYQVGSGRPVEIRAVLNMLLTDCPAEVEVVVDASRARPSESPVVWGDTSKMEAGIGWSRNFGLETTLRDLKSYWKSRLG